MELVIEQAVFIARQIEAFGEQYLAGCHAT
jgi:hypothetical protein